MTGPELLVRQAGAADSGALRAMAQRCSLLTLRNRMHWGAPAPVLAAHLALVAADPRAVVLVAERGNRAAVRLARALADESPRPAGP